MDFNKAEIKQRIFSPRIVIYLILAIAAAWMMQRFGNYAPQEKKLVSAPTVISGKSIEELPLIVVIPTAGEDLAPEIALTEQELNGKAQVSLLNVAAGDTASIKALFKVGTLPAAILYAPDNTELKRVEGVPIDAAMLVKLGTTE